MVNTTWIFTGDNYDPNYPGIPCNVTTSTGECVSVSTILLGTLAFSIALFVCLGYLSWKREKKCSIGLHSATTEKTKLVASGIV